MQGINKNINNSHVSRTFIKTNEWFDEIETVYGTKSDSESVEFKKSQSRLIYRGM